MALDPPAKTAAEDETGTPERAPALAGSVPPGAFPPSRDWKAGGDLLGTTRTSKTRREEPSEADDGLMEPGIFLDESKDLLVISESACLSKLLAHQRKRISEDLQDQPGADKSWTNAVVDTEPAAPEPDSEVLARAADWIDW